jgi:hypothetical protein
MCSGHVTAVVRACAALTLPAASADPVEPVEPTTEATTSAVGAEAVAPAADDCNAAACPR